MAKKEPHVGMVTHVFTCADGDTFRVHGHSQHGPHNHEVRTVRKKLSKGCTALKLRPGVVHRTKKPGQMRGVPCGKPVKETVIEHETPARVEPDPKPSEAPAEG